MRSLILFCTIIISLSSQAQTDLRNTKIDGYRGIWFELNQKYEYGDKYSGGLGTYTAKHIPLAIYAPEVEKTFFVYGGTTNQNERHLLCMIGAFDHQTKMVTKPTVVYDKLTVDDPHDNPSMMIDDEGFIWVFVSGRGTKRKGIKLKSEKPYDISAFTIEDIEEFTYPQIWNTQQGFFHFFTKYTGQRELYFETSLDGESWTNDRKLVGIKENDEKLSGHYQLSNHFSDGEIIGTFFNRHINGHPDTRTNLYYLQTKDFGKTWQDIHENSILLPLSKDDGQGRVIDYLSQQKNVYMKDMGFDKKGNPICLTITSGGHEPGPKNAPYEWKITRWTGKKWKTAKVCESDHNYDMGSLFIEGKTWKVVGPTENPPQEYGVGGEIVIWVSKNKGRSWKKEQVITHSSSLNHAYVRRPLHGKAPFSFFWADGHAHEFGKSELYFGDFEGNVWKLPYEMGEEKEMVTKIKN